MFSNYLFRWSSYYKIPDPDRRLIAYSWCDLYRFGLSFIRSALLKGFLSLAALASLANNSEATIKEKRFRLLHMLKSISFKTWRASSPATFAHCTTHRVMTDGPINSNWSQAKSRPCESHRCPLVEGCNISNVNERQH